MYKLIIQIWIFYLTAFYITRDLLCDYYGTCSKIKFDTGILFIKDVNVLETYYENYYLLNKLLCTMVNSNIKFVCRHNYQTSLIQDSINYKNMETNINDIYYQYKTLCNNKKILFDLNDEDIKEKVDYYCYEKKTNNILNYITRFVYNNIVILIVIIVNIGFKLVLQYKNKFGIDDYTSKIQFTENDDCPICHLEYTKNDDIRKLNVCNHNYHRKCIETWIEEYKHDTCPMCRKHIW